MDQAACFFRVVNVMWVNVNPLAFILYFLTSFGLRLGWFAVFVKQWLDQCQ
jgi:hypothetical protein